MKTRTITMKSLYIPPPMPNVERGVPTVSTKLLKTPTYVLMDEAGRYKIASVDYEEFGRQDFLDIEGSEYISRRHFSIKEEGGQLYIKDLESHNGTYVNNRDIRGLDWVPLKEGDIVEIAGVVKLRVQKALDI